VNDVYQARDRVVPSDDDWRVTPLGVRTYVAWIDAELGRAQALLAFTEQQHRDELRARDRALALKDRQILRLEQQLALARESVALTSHNSSKPPSSDPPSSPRPAAKARTGRRRGGQPGHVGHVRRLVPVEHVTSVIDHTPQRCAQCDGALSGHDPSPLRHQVVELAVARPLVIEHRLHSVTCACGHTTRACLPEGVTANGFGPGVEATVAQLAAGCRLSHRMICSVMADLFGVRMGLGTVTRLLARSGEAVEPSVDEARAFVRCYEGAKHVDETGWMQRGADGTNEDERRAWLWVVATEAVTLFEAALSRGKAVAKTILGEVPVGTVVTDRYHGYRFIDVDARQLCWAHLVREFTRMSERAGPPGTLGRQLKRLTEKLFRLWGRYRDGRLAREVWESETCGVRWRMRTLLERGAGVVTRKDERSARTRTKTTCQELLKVEPAMWTFLKQPAVGITNNAAERALRHAVLWRRVSFGSQSQAGAQRAARLLTVVQTLRSRGESVYAYLLEASRAAHERRPGPRLVPAIAPRE
jgi:transposase